MAITYRDAGVDIDAAARAIDLVKQAVRATHGPEVLAGIGAFGGLFDGQALRDMKAPVLVASTDGVGTKTALAAALGRYDGIGKDLVNHCIDDILVQGATPLFFLDYVATSQLDPEIIAAVVRGVAEACGAAGCALLGGETAEMPGVYLPGALDLAGTIVGVVERDGVIDGSALEPGDQIVGLSSSGPHTNGYSLIRRLFDDDELRSTPPGLDRVLGEALLEPHRCYLGPVQGLRAAGVDLKAMAHITGGGLYDNPPRVLPDGCAARLHRDTWPVPPLFALIQEKGALPDEEMARVFNLGLGILLFVAAGEGARVVEQLGAEAWIVGEVVERGEQPPVLFD